jgi:hypothetical protein
MVGNAKKKRNYFIVLITVSVVAALTAWGVVSITMPQDFPPERPHLIPIVIKRINITSIAISIASWPIGIHTSIEDVKIQLTGIQNEKIPITEATLLNTSKTKVAHFDGKTALWTSYDETNAPISKIELGLGMQIVLSAELIESGYHLSITGTGFQTGTRPIEG